MTVYCIKRRFDASDLLKFGYTENIEQRLRAYRQQHPEGVELLVAIPGDRHLEAVVLELLRDHNAVGEWFHQSEDVSMMVGALKRVASRRRGVVGDIPCRAENELAAPPTSSGRADLVRALWAAAPDLSAVSDDAIQEVRSLDWDTRLQIAIAFREWGAAAAEWVMPELKMGKPDSGRV